MLLALPPLPPRVLLNRGVRAINLGRISLDVGVAGRSWLQGHGRRLVRSSGSGGLISADRRERPCRTRRSDGVDDTPFCEAESGKTSRDHGDSVPDGDGHHSDGSQGNPSSRTVAAGAAAAVLPSLASSGGDSEGTHTSNVNNVSIAAKTAGTAKMRVSFGGAEFGRKRRSGGAGDPSSTGEVQRAGGGGGGSGVAKTTRRPIKREGTTRALKRGSESNGGDGGTGGGGGILVPESSHSNGLHSGVAQGVGGGAGGGGARPRRRARRESREDGSSRGSMDTLTTTSVSTVTRGVAMQWKPRLNVELGSFVYPSLMLESTQRLEADGWAHDTGGGNSKRLVTGKSVRGLNKLGRQPTRKGKDMSGSGNRLGLEGDGGHLEEEKSRSRLGRTRPDSDTTAVPPPLTWILNVEPEQVRKRPTSGVLTLKFSQPLLPGAVLGADGSTTLEMERESSCSGSIVTAQGDVGQSNRSGASTIDERRVAAKRWGGGGDDFTSLSSKWSSCSFEECLKAGEEKLREEIHRLHDELNEPSGDETKNLTGTGVLAAQARSIMANDKTRKIAAAMSTKGRASAVQYQKLLSRPSANWTNVGRIVSKMTPLGLRDIKNRDKLEMRAELKRLEKERHDEEDRRIAHDFEEQRIRAKMANSRLKQLVSVEDKLLAKESYFAQFQQAARTRYGGHFDGGSSGGTGIGAMAPRPGIGSRGGGRPKGTASRRGGNVSSAGSSRGSVMYQTKPGPVAVPQASDGSKRQAMAREVFIVACLELGLHPDLSQVRWNLGTIDLSHFGLGDRLSEALAASLKHSPPESLCLRDNRMTDSPLRVIISALDVDSLVKLDLSENRAGPGAMKTLCSFLEDGSCLETLVLRATNLGDAEVAPLCETLGGNDMLLSLNLSRNNLRSAGASSLAKMLSSPSCGLQELDISWNCCSGKGTVELGEALKHQCTLRKLEVAFNSFSDDGTMALAIALLDNRQLTSLGFSWNRIGGRASLALSRMLCLNSTLRKLDLSGNPLTETGGRSILRALLGGSACDVGMRGCSFLEDNSLLFDRNYPPPLISMDLDLKNAFQCCVLHELIGLAQAKPGSKFVEVYRHSGGGRGRTPVTLQVVEDLKGGTRRAAVIDSGTGQPWTPPDSGWISIKFKASRELPSIKDVLNPEAAWTAMMLIMGQESDSDRMNVLRLVLRDTYVTTESGQKLIDQLSNMGIFPRDVVEMVWTRVVDANNLYGFLSHNVEYSARRDVVNILTHERFKFNWDNPTGHYRLEMDKKSHREIMMLLSMVHSREIQQGKREGRGDTSQAQNWSNFRNARIDKEPVELTEASATNLPVSGVLEFDYVSTAKAPPDSVPATDAQVQALQESLHLLPRRIFGEKPNYMLAVLQLQQAAARYYFTSPQVIRILDCFQHTKLQASALAALFGRTWDLENFDAVLATLPAGVDKQAASRLGFLNVLNPLKIARHYELNIMHPDERRLIKLLLEKGDNLLEDHTTDLQIIDLYAGLGRLVDEKKPMVVRLWYCDIGVRGNVPNWTVREKLLDKFLLGGKPVPERVFEIVRMYKRMAEAGFLAKEPGMGAADIAKAHGRFLRHLQDVKRSPGGVPQSRGARRSLAPGKGQQQQQQQQQQRSRGESKTAPGPTAAAAADAAEPSAQALA